MVVYGLYYVMHYTNQLFTHNKQFGNFAIPQEREMSFFVMCQTGREIIY